MRRELLKWREPLRWRRGAPRVRRVRPERGRGDCLLGPGAAEKVSSFCTSYPPLSSHILGRWWAARAGWWLVAGDCGLVTSDVWLGVCCLVAGAWCEVLGALVPGAWWRLVAGGWWMAAASEAGGCLAIGGWQLAAGGRLSTSDWRLSGGWRLAIGGWLSAGGWGLSAASRRLLTGGRRLSAGVRQPKYSKF